MKQLAYLLRPMASQDLEAVLGVQRLAYTPDLHESLTVFSSKLERFPDSNWVIQGERGLLAYLFAQPARYLHPPPLNDCDAAVAGADALHLHDMAVAPRSRGLGLAGQLVAAGLNWGRHQNLAWATLIAVQDSRSFWQAHGFCCGSLEKSLDSYGQGARYMYQSLLG